MLKPAFSFVCFLSVSGSAVGGSSDWPQWRGVDRNGIARSGELADSWGVDGPPKLWTSDEKIPSNDDGGHGSPVVADGRVYLSVVWHTDVPTDTRVIDDLVVRKLGGQHQNMPRAMVDKVEATRMSLSPRLRGSRLDEWTEKWMTENLSPEQKLNYDWWVKGRLKKGKAAIHVEDLDKILVAKGRLFSDHSALEEWVAGLDVSDEVKERVIAAVPGTKKVAQDVVIAVDAATGKTVWKSTFDGEPTGRGSSSTPCVQNGRVYAIGSREVYCVDAANGRILWRTPVEAKGAGSSPLFVDGRVVVNAGSLAALDAETGKKLWELEKTGGKNGSPVAWKDNSRTVIVCNVRKDMVGVDLKTGEVLWSIDGGGDSTPVIGEGTLICYAKGKPHRLIAYDLKSDTKPVKRWEIKKMVRRAAASPIIHGGHVYLLGGDMHLCVDAKTGEPAWDMQRGSSISSPVLADGKLFVLENRGSQIVMLKATPEEHAELGRAKVQTMNCPSPAIAGDRLILRMENGLACYDLSPPKATP